MVPLQDANLSFTNIGRVTAVNVKVGDKVSAGDVLVQLDKSILEARVREAEANLAYAQISLDYLIRNVGCKGVNCAPFQQQLDVAVIQRCQGSSLKSNYAKAVLAASIGSNSTILLVPLYRSKSPRMRRSPPGRSLVSG